MKKIKIAFFDAKDYDRNSVIRANEKAEYEISFLRPDRRRTPAALPRGMMRSVFLSMMTSTAR